MKTIKLTTTSVLAVMALGAFASTASAQDVTYTTEGQVSYIPATKPTDPVDPSNPLVPVTPINPIDPTVPVIPGTPGPLSIDYISSFNFGEQEITSSDVTYHAAEQKFDNGTKGPNYVQVTDNRGTLAGWTLSVMQTAQFSTGGTGTGTTLDGAEITLDNGAIVSASASKADTFAKTTKLVPGTQSATILGATAGTGTGTNLLAFGKSADSNTGTSVTLMVPGATTKLAQKYMTSLTWTLSDTPAP